MNQFYLKKVAKVQNKYKTLPLHRKQLIKFNFKIVQSLARGVYLWSWNVKLYE